MLPGSNEALQQGMNNPSTPQKTGPNQEPREVLATALALAVETMLVLSFVASAVCD